MTKVDFYTGSPDKLRTACQLSHKAMQAQLKVVITLPDAQSCDGLNRLLWQQPVSSFIPHCRLDDELAERTPVLLALAETQFPHHQLLISLQDETPNFFSRFERVIEIVGADEADSLRGRARFKFYRDRGYELRHIDLSKKPQ
ncbi:MAG: DNA polymerase III subunit chi [Gallionella sp.]